VKVEKSGDLTERMLVSLLQSQNTMLRAVAETQRAVAELQRRLPPTAPLSLGQFLMGGPPNALLVDPITNAERSVGLSAAMSGNRPPGDGEGGSTPS
jgi:hypothetical protein